MHLIGFSEKEIEHDEETMWFQWRKLSKGTYPDTFLVKFTNSNDKKIMPISGQIDYLQIKIIRLMSLILEDKWFWT